MPRAVDGELQDAIDRLQAQISVDPEIQAILAENRDKLIATRDKGGAARKFQHLIRDQVSNIARRKGMMPLRGSYFINPNDGQLEPHGGWAGLSSGERAAVIAAVAGVTAVGGAIVANVGKDKEEMHSPTTGNEPIPAHMPRGDSVGLRIAINDLSVRPRLSATQMQSFIPRDAHRFVFPQPWGTQAVRLVAENGGRVHPTGMTFWSNMNNSEGRDTVHVFLSINDVITILDVNKSTLEVSKLRDTPFRGTGEYLYWSYTEPDILFVPHDNRLIRYNVARNLQETAFTAPGPIQHVHSSADGKSHSMTLNNGPAVFWKGLLRQFDSDGYDECHISKSGNHLLIKKGGNNLVYNFPADTETLIVNKDGAVGHADVGYDYIVGEDDENTAYGGTFRLWNLSTFSTRIVYHMGEWTPMTRYVSHCNAKPGPAEGQTLLFSSSSKLDVPRANEIVLGRIGDDSIIVVCPNMNDITPYPDNAYWPKTRACIDPTGGWACFTGNCGEAEWVVPIMVRLPSW